VAKTIQKELALVEKKSQETTERLHLAVDSHIGLDILHKFILDILGRDTPPAKIFANKTDEDFRRSIVQTRHMKVIAAVIIFAANALFIYYSILRGLYIDVDFMLLFVANLFHTFLSFSPFFLCPFSLLLSLSLCLFSLLLSLLLPFPFFLSSPQRYPFLVI
jgi:hypothetical protein